MQHTDDSKKVPHQDSCLSAKSAEMSPFQKLISQARDQQYREKAQVESDLRIASDIILSKAAAHLPPDEYNMLEKSLVKIYMGYTK